MNDQVCDQIFKLLQQIDSRLIRVEEKLNNRSIFESLSYDDPDPLLPEAIELTLKHRKASASLIMRFMKIGYARSASILDQMEKAGVVGMSDGAKPRKIFVDKCTDFLSRHKSTTAQDETK